MFCKRCRYNLKAIESRACPECGRAFDPQNRKTYRKRMGLPKWVRRIGQGLVVLFFVALIALCVNEVRYQRELVAVELVVQSGGGVVWSDEVHQWAEWIPFLHERLQHVEVLQLGGYQLTALPPEIGKFAKLKAADLGDNQLIMLPPEIGKLTKLEWLIVSDNQLTTLSPAISKLTNLEVLWVSNNPITDADLEHLKSLMSLKELDTTGTDFTREGVAALKLALPNCEIISSFD